MHLTFEYMLTCAVLVTPSIAGGSSYDGDSESRAMWRFNPADLRAGFAWPCTFLKPTRGGSSGGGGGAAAVIEGSTPKRSGELPSSPTAWGPCGRFGHTATVAPQTDKKGFYIFGGQSEGGHLNDVWCVKSARTHVRPRAYAHNRLQTHAKKSLRKCDRKQQ